MTPVEIDTYHDVDFDHVAALWEQVLPGTIAQDVIPAKQVVQPDLLLVARLDGRVIGTTMAGYDGHRGWLYAVAVAPDHRHRGIATRLIREAEVRLTALGCRKINLQIRGGNDGVAAFYERLGYVAEDRISMGRRI